MIYETGIRPAIDAYLLKKSQEVRSYGDYWSGSSAGYCMRKVIFDRLGLPPVKDDPRKQRVFESGHVFHEWMQRITRDAGLSIAQELELQDEDLMIRGHIDDLVLVKSEMLMNSVEFPQGEVKSGSQTANHLILYDYKTVNSRSFAYKKDKMSHYHRMQLGTYMYMIRNGSGVFNEFDRSHLPKGSKTITVYEGETSQVKINDLTEARIMNISKDDLRMSEQVLIWDAKLEKEVVGYWTTLNGYWKNRTLPKCTCADYEGGFMARENYNPYFYQGEPCSIEYLNKCKKEGLIVQPAAAN